jgi:hypothetical protein
MMELLIQRGANVNEATLTAATQAGHADALQLLLLHGPPFRYHSPLSSQTTRFLHADARVCLEASCCCLRSPDVTLMWCAC